MVNVKWHNNILSDRIISNKLNYYIVLDHLSIFNIIIIVFIYIYVKI